MLPATVFHILTFILFSELCRECSADVFSAMFKMEHLLETRQRVIDGLDTYIHKEENRLRDLKMYLKMYKTEHERAIKDKINYTGNPINAFILIKRLTSDLDDIEEIINKTTEFVSVRNMTTDHNNATILYPSAVDLQGAAVALKRLQRTYKLRVEDLARGVVNGVLYRVEMTASDCYKMGVIMFKKKDYLNALAWQKEALRKLKLEDNVPHAFTEIDVMDNIANVYYHLSDPDTALEWTLKILSLDPVNELAKENFVVYLKQITKNERAGKVPIKDTKPENHDDNAELKTNSKNQTDKELLEMKSNNKTENYTQIETDEKKEADNINDGNKFKATDLSDTNVLTCKKNESTNADLKNVTDTNGDTCSESEYNADLNTTVNLHTNVTDNSESEKKENLVNFFIDFRKDFIMYEALCRKEYDMAPEIASRLTCYYLNDKPFLKLAPIKVEQKYIDPDVFLFHNVMSDAEIAHVQEMAKPQAVRARVGFSEDNTTAVAEYRISQSSWLYNDESVVISRLSQRIADFTGLSIQYAEPLQVANYGVGGHYEPHFDYFGKVVAAEKQSDRIATTMFYMSDVAQGGATVFPKLGLSVFPVKGSAVFWMNLLPSGEGNQNTRHAACPVLEGSKWVSNKWISTKGQEFIKPCNLEHQREEVIQPRPAPVLKPEALDEISSL